MSIHIEEAHAPRTMATIITESPNEDVAAAIDYNDGYILLIDSPDTENQTVMLGTLDDYEELSHRILDAVNRARRAGVSA